MELSLFLTSLDLRRHDKVRGNGTNQQWVTDKHKTQKKKKNVVPKTERDHKGLSIHV